MRSHHDALDTLELELRRLPGVVGVGFSEVDGVTVVHVMALMPEGMAALRRQVVQLARGLADHTLMIDLQELRVAPADSDRGRVKLVAVRVEQFTQDLEIHLAHRGVHTVGRAVAGSPERAVDATLRALADLGADLAFRVEAAATAVEADNERQQAVIVILQPEDETRGTRYGVAKGTSIEEAAARATLHALNRYLSRDEPLSSAS